MFLKFISLIKLNLKQVLFLYLVKYYVEKNHVFNSKSKEIGTNLIKGSLMIL
jgi:hypothetical protein